MLPPPLSEADEFPVYLATSRWFDINDFVEWAYEYAVKEEAGMINDGSRMDKDIIIAYDELRKQRLMKGKRPANNFNSRRRAGVHSPFLYCGEVLELVPVCRQTLFKMIRLGGFPGPTGRICGANVWSKDEVQEWINEKLGHRG